MAILEKEVLVTCGVPTDKHFESLGYLIPKYFDRQGRMKVKKGTKILVNVGDLLNSGIKLTKVCDECGKNVPNQPYSAILRYRKNGDGLDRCNNCASKVGGHTRKTSVEYENSLEYWAKENNKNYLLSEFSAKNNYNPNQISFGSDQEYLWNCPKCKSEYEMKVCDRTNKGSNCPYCRGFRVNHTNCLWTTHPEVAKFLVFKEIGYKVTAGSHKKVDFNCRECGYLIRNKTIKDIIKQGIPCPKCSDGLSYPEKMMTSLLNQLNINFETQKTFEWSKDVKCENKKLNGSKKYDFYIPSVNCIIETNGNQHYNRSFVSLGGKILEDEQENDYLKEKLAKDNGIEKYIIINCSTSNYQFIKNNIIDSHLSVIFNLSNINWLKCHEFACSTLVKEVSELWENGIKNSNKIGEILKLNRTTIIRFLKRGTELGWCNYDSKEEMLKSNKLNAQKNHKAVIQLSLNGEFINEYISMKEAAKSINVDPTSITKVCKGKHKTASGFKWMYKEDYENQFTIKY